MTPLDQLCPIPFHEADAAGRARILSQLADTELFAALIKEPVGDQVDLRIFDLPDGPVALACDAEDRLADFLDGPVAYVGLPGRVLAAVLAAEHRGLLLNPGQVSQMLLEPDMLAWLVRALDARPSLAPDEAPVRVRPPLAETATALAAPISRRLGDMAGLVLQAALFASDWADGRVNHTLLLSGVAPERRDAVAKALAELLAFLPEQPGGVDLGFADTPPPACALLIDPPAHVPDEPAPQRDANAPPRLRW